MKTKEEAMAMSPAPTATIKVESMPYTDRGGYGSTGERSAGASIAEGRTFRDANGLELHVGDYVIDELGECFCVMGLNREDGATAAYADLGEGCEEKPMSLLRDVRRPKRLLHSMPARSVGNRPNLRRKHETRPDRARKEARWH